MLARAFAKLFPPPRYLAMPALGVDLSDRSLKFVSLKRGRDGLGLAAWGERDLPAGAVVGGEVREVAPVQEVLRALARDTGEKLVVASLPEEPSYTVRLVLPGVARRDLRQGIELQLDQYVPLPTSELIFDYDIVRAPSEPKGTYELAVSAFPRAGIISYQKLFAGTGLWPISLETEAEALARALAAPNEPVTAIIDFGRLHVGLAIVLNGQVLRSSTIDEIGGDMLTQAIAKGVSVAPDEAESRKRKEGMATDLNDAVHFALLPALSVLREEISKFISSWQVPEVAGPAREPVGQVLLVGGQALLPGLADYLAAALNRPVKLGDPRRRLSARAAASLTAPESVRYATAIGLAMRSHYLSP